MEELILACSSAIHTIHSSINILGSGKTEHEVPQTFIEFRRELIVIHECLLEYRRRIQAEKDPIPGSLCEDLKTHLQSILTKSMTVEEILEKSMSGERYLLKYQYLKAVYSLGRKKGVEDILFEIAEDTKLLIKHDALSVADKSQIESLELMFGEETQIRSSDVDKSIPSFVSDNREEATLQPSSSQACLLDFRMTDPREDKVRIERSSGGLLRDSYCWILENKKFQQWQGNSNKNSLLWVRGTPGKGKTMLLCGIIDELEDMFGETANICFFFCQASDRRINDASSVLRGLIHLLVTKQPSLVSHIQAQYEKEGKKSFSGRDTVKILSSILKEILIDSSLRDTYLIIDALDECTTGLLALLQLISQTSSNHRGVRWIVSSRHYPLIRDSLRTSNVAPFLLKLDGATPAGALDKFIRNEVDGLATTGEYSNETHDEICHSLSDSSQGNFLWVSLVCRYLERVRPWNAVDSLRVLPLGLYAFYKHMIDEIHDATDIELGKRILAVMSLALEPVTFHELVYLVDLPAWLSRDFQALSDFVDMVCGSFLNVQANTLSFVHETARQFILEDIRTGGLFWISDQVSIHDIASSFGNLYHKLGRLDEAEKMYKRALLGLDRDLGPNERQTLQTCKELGDLYCERAKFDEAEMMYERAQIPLAHSSQGPVTSTVLSSTKDSIYANEDSKDTQTALTSVEEGLSAFETKSIIDNSDRQSLYSQRTDLYSADQHISGIAHILQQRLEWEPGDFLTGEYIQVVLEQCLKAFAVQLGHEIKSQESLRAMVFIRHYRKHIASSLRELWDKELDSKRTEYYMPYSEKVEMFFDTMQDDAQIHPDAFHNTEPSSYASDIFPNHSDDWFHMHETKPADEPAFDFEYSDLIQSQAFRWLLTRLWRQVHLTTTDPDNLSIIKKKILDELPISSQVSSSRQVETYSVVFNVNWDPRSFIVEQEYGKDADEAIATAVTITGGPEFTQAATTKEYLEQTWPISGMWVLEVLREVALHGSGDFESDGFRIAASIQDGMTIVEAHGTEELIAELGEQLAWLGSALRSSLYDKGVSYCNPCLRLTPTSTFDSSGLHHTAENRPNISFHIDFTVNQKVNVVGIKGTCWHDMFRAPVVVEGFPIPRRSNHDYGLHLPLHIMAALIRARQATDFDRRLFIKGFSAILFPTHVVGDTMTWHLLFNHDGSHISYLDPRIKSLQDTQARDISLVQLTNARVHVVGWCSKANSYAGSSKAKFPIDRSDCGETHARWLIEKFSITTGKYINFGASFSLGVRDKPIFLGSASSYDLQILRMSEKFILLYDVADRRAWLVNGASALLHLVIATLKYEELTPIGKKLLNRVEALKTVGGEYRADSAMHILIDEENMDLPILPGRKRTTREIEKRGDPAKNKTKESNILFSDRVEQVIDYLEKAFIYQEEMLYEPGQKIKLPSRRLLAGFDFADIAESHSTLPRRIAELKSTGKAWIEFIWKIKAVALFGRGFGDIISPNEASCDTWKKMPTGVDYLAVCTYDLQNIIKRFGVRGQSDMQVVQGLFWHKPDKLFDCTCQQTKSVSCDRAQTLLPDKFKFRRFLKRIVPPGATDGSEEGAIIFGNGKKLPINWPDDPEEIAHEGQLTHECTDEEGLQVRTDPASSSVSTTSQVDEGLSTDRTEGSSSTVPSSQDGLQETRSGTDKK